MSEAPDTGRMGTSNTDVLGRWSDKDGNVIYAQPANTTNEGKWNSGPMHHYRTIAAGTTFGAGLPSGALGTLSHQPVGLGFLVTGGYTDVSVFYCASASDMYPDGTRRDSKNTAKYRSPSQLGDWKTAGGYGGATLTHGGWNKVANQWFHRYQNSGSNGYITRGVQCAFAYRNTPFGTSMGCNGREFACATRAGWETWEETGDGSALMPQRDGFQVPYAVPERRLLPMEPMFKTEKQLGGRAIASDAWSRMCMADHSAGSPEVSWNDDVGARPLGVTGGAPAPGRGSQAHKEGYNVLYGDAHVMWWGDPQQTFAWVDSSGGRGGAGSNQLWSGEGHPGSPGGYAVAGVRNTSLKNGFWQWHQLDTKAGLDVTPLDASHPAGTDYTGTTE
ncbi:MAG TPA: hypothetical protein P5137_13005 [Candidatus Brocadiia bacterium]|nr:hypothetical protein [Candidatus Brocadiia bacterium]